MWGSLTRVRHAEVYVGLALCALSLAFTMPSVMHQRRIVEECKPVEAVVNMNSIKTVYSNFMNMKKNKYFVPELFYEYTFKGHKYTGNQFFASYEQLTINNNKYYAWAESLIQKVLNNATAANVEADKRPRITVCIDEHKPSFSFAIRSLNIVPYIVAVLPMQVIWMILSQTTVFQLPFTPPAIHLNESWCKIISGKPANLWKSLICSLLCLVSTWPLILHYVLCEGLSPTMGSVKLDLWIYFAYVECLVVPPTIIVVSWLKLSPPKIQLEARRPKPNVLAFRVEQQITEETTLKSYQLTLVAPPQSTAPSQTSTHELSPPKTLQPNTTFHATAEFKVPAKHPIHEPNSGWKLTYTPTNSHAPSSWLLNLSLQPGSTAEAYSTLGNSLSQQYFNGTKPVLRTLHPAVPICELFQIIQFFPLLWYPRRILWPYMLPSLSLPFPQEQKCIRFDSQLTPVVNWSACKNEIHPATAGDSQIQPPPWLSEKHHQSSSIFGSRSPQLVLFPGGPHGSPIAITLPTIGTNGLSASESHDGSQVTTSKAGITGKMRGKNDNWHLDRYIPETDLVSVADASVSAVSIGNVLWDVVTEEKKASNPADSEACGDCGKEDDTVISASSKTTPVHSSGCPEPHTQNELCPNGTLICSNGHLKAQLTSVTAGKDNNCGATDSGGANESHEESGHSSMDWTYQTTEDGEEIEIFEEEVEPEYIFVEVSESEDESEETFLQQDGPLASNGTECPSQPDRVLPVSVQSVEKPTEQQMHPTPHSSNKDCVTEPTRSSSPQFSFASSNNPDIVTQIPVLKVTQSLHVTQIEQRNQTLGQSLTSKPSRWDVPQENDMKVLYHWNTTEENQESPEPARAVKGCHLEEHTTQPSQPIVETEQNKESLEILQEYRKAQDSGIEVQTDPKNGGAGIVEKEHSVRTTAESQTCPEGSTAQAGNLSTLVPTPTQTGKVNSSPTKPASGSGSRSRSRSSSSSAHSNSSQSRSRTRSQSTSRSRSRSRSRIRSRSRGRNQRRNKSRSPIRRRSRSRSTSRRGKRGRSRSVSRGRRSPNTRQSTRNSHSRRRRLSRSRSRSRIRRDRQCRRLTRSRSRSRNRIGDVHRNRSRSRSRNRGRNRSKSRSPSKNRPQRSRSRSVSKTRRSISRSPSPRVLNQSPAKEQEAKRRRVEKPTNTNQTPIPNLPIRNSTITTYYPPNNSNCPVRRATPSFLDPGGINGRVITNMPPPNTTQQEPTRVQQVSPDPVGTTEQSHPAEAAVNIPTTPMRSRLSFAVDNRNRPRINKVNQSKCDKPDYGQCTSCHKKFSAAHQGIPAFQSHFCTVTCAVLKAGKSFMDFCGVVPHSTATEAKERVIQSFRANESITESQFNFSLKCPISQGRIVTASRGIHCGHLQCFDLLAFLSINKDRINEKWKCPLCSQPCPFEGLCIDEYFNIIATTCLGKGHIVSVFPNADYHHQDEAAPGPPPTKDIVDLT
ncbi:E3 SUMO-protein ligase PIAS1 [Pelomyxa schiedti]|nr:E3 SUMO-protein ligase PIAS1 [Pelomyxa schiedti]